MIYVSLSKETLFKCTCLVGIKSASVRPAKIEFSNPLIKNDFMRNLNKHKGASIKFKNVSTKHDMAPEERSKKKQLHPKTGELNNGIQNDASKNSFCGERNHMGQKNRESEKTTKTDNSSGSEQIHVFL